MTVTIEMVEPAILKQWIAEGSAHVIDVREPPERAAESIDGTIAGPLSQFDGLGLAMPPGKKLVFHCRSGVRCGKAAEQLEATGFEGTIYRLRGGLLAWKEAGLPTQAGDG
ncbi:MAG: rhodanese-like domain-containing protein [Alphaproteobacteria bacterium]